MTSWLLAFFFAGIVWYVLDRAYFVKPHRFVYNLFHREPLPAEVEKGLIYHQSAGRKFLWALVISTVQSIAVLWYVGFAHFNPLVEFILWLFEIPAMVLGMIVGPIIYGWWINRKKMYTTIDDIESGKLDLKEEATDAVIEKTEKVKGALSHFIDNGLGLVSKCWPMKKKVQPKMVEMPRPVVREPSIEESRAAVEKFTGRKS